MHNYLFYMSKRQQEKHGMFGTRTYDIWAAMKKRCLNPRHHAYKNYGARGISVCERWNLFSNFYADMGAQPKGMTLERIDNNNGACKTPFPTIV